MATFKALVLDERDVLRGVVELADESELTERHIDLRPFGGDCDNKPGEYRWDREKKQLMPLPRVLRAVEGRPTMEQALAFHLLKQAMLPEPKPELSYSQSTELIWLDDALRSMDFQLFLRLPIVQDYLVARNLVLKKGI